MSVESDPEAERVRREYSRRARSVGSEVYAAWQPAEAYMRANRRFRAAALLRKRGRFPGATAKVLEVGVGEAGWLPELLSWGLVSSQLAGADVREDAVASCSARMPGVDCRVVEPASLPWQTGMFSLVVASTVFSSVLGDQPRRGLSNEILRVLQQDGAVLWYDLAVGNPWNQGVRPVTSAELDELFPDMDKSFVPMTLPPPVVRRAPDWLWPWLFPLERLSPFKSHLLGVFERR